MSEEQRARLELMRAAARADEARLQARTKARRRTGLRELCIAIVLLALAPACLVVAQGGSDAFLLTGMLFASGGLAGLVKGITELVTGRSVTEQPEPLNVLLPLLGLALMIAAPLLLLAVWFSI